VAFEIDRLIAPAAAGLAQSIAAVFGLRAKAKGIRNDGPARRRLRPINNLDSMAELVRALSASAAGGDPKAG